MAVKIKPPNNKLIRSVNGKVRKCKKERHRPTVAAIVKHRTKKSFLLIEPKVSLSGVGTKNPGIVKGGIKRGEGILSALFRELEEELSMQPSQLKVLGYGGSRSVLSVKQKSGLLMKRYFFFYVEYEGPLAITINPLELSSYRWFTLKEIREEIKILLELRPDKYAVLDAAFAALEKKKNGRSKSLKSGKLKKTTKPRNRKKAA